MLGNNRVKIMNYFCYILAFIADNIIVSHSKNYTLHKCNALGDILNDAIGAQK